MCSFATWTGSAVGSRGHKIPSSSTGGRTEMRMARYEVTSVRPFGECRDLASIRYGQWSEAGAHNNPLSATLRVLSGAHCSPGC
jgi:hypothetical protein